MALSLEKGDKVSLSKAAADAGSTLSAVTIGLGWKAKGPEPRTVEKRGLFGRRKTVVAASSQYEFDLDASVFVLGSDGRVLSKKWFVYYGHKESPNREVVHSGDNLVGGSGKKDDEQIVVRLDRLPAEAQRVVVVVDIYNAKFKGQSFGDVKESYMRILDDRSSELARYNLTEEFGGKTAVTFGELRRVGNEWLFAAIGDGHNAHLGDLARTYGA